MERNAKETKLTSDLPEMQERTNLRMIAVLALISFLFGVAGSVFGSAFFTKQSLPGALIPGQVTTVQVEEQSAVVEVVKKSSPAVVSIIVTKDLNKVPGFSSSPFNFGPFALDPFFNSRGGSDTVPNIQQVGGGTGFIISSDGLIATNKHVVGDEDATYTVLTNDGEQYDAQVLARDPTNDIALVKINAQNLPTLPLGDSDGLERGQKVIAIGNSLGEYHNTVTTGVVSGIGRTIVASDTNLGSEQLEGVIQTDAAINPGNSGGPLLDIGGSVIGINTAIDSQGQLVGFAIPVNDLKLDLDSFNRFGRIVKPMLGIRYVLVTETIQEEHGLSVNYGALIVSGGSGAPGVLPNSAAQKAGIKEGDVILEFNGQPINTDSSLASMIKKFVPGDIVVLKVLSGEEEKEVTITLGESR